MNMQRTSGWLMMACLLTLPLMGGCPITQSQDTPVDHKWEVCSATDRGYYLYVPSTYDAQKSYPVVITLHGTWPWDVANFQIREWKALAEKKQFIVIAPKLRSAQGILPVIESVWMQDLEKDDQHILAVLGEVSEKFTVDPKRVLLTGFSAGGYAMYNTGLRHPNKFQMLVARACNSDKRIFCKIPLNKNTRRIPVNIFVGKDDSALQASSWEAFSWLRRHGWDKTNSKRTEKRGGHLRRPSVAYEMWQPGGPK